jgi:hypothetical protein
VGRFKGHEGKSSISDHPIFCHSCDKGCDWRSSSWTTLVNYLMCCLGWSGHLAAHSDYPHEALMRTFPGTVQLGQHGHALNKGIAVEDEAQMDSDGIIHAAALAHMVVFLHTYNRKVCSCVT